MNMQIPLQIFYCYAREDRIFRDALDRHLSGLKRQKILITWSDREIAAGEEWKHSIDTHIQRADIILCLVSPDFLASDYCYEQEMQQALKRHKKGVARILPILVRPTYWKNMPLGELQMLPSDALAVILWPHPDAAWVDVVKGILSVIQELSLSPIPEEEIKNNIPESVQPSIGELKIEEKSSTINSEAEAHLYTDFEERYAEINHLLAHKQALQALEQFKNFDLVELPLFLRWRVLSLRGQAYFEQRDFSKAQCDFQSTLAILPASVSPEHQLEVIRLRLHLAEATRELNQLEAALEYYLAVLTTMDASTSLRDVVETHWGIALVYYNQAHSSLTQNESESESQARRQHLLQEAWQHAEYARNLYYAIVDTLNADLLQCQMALIEQAQGKAEQARHRLIKIVNAWKPTIEDGFQQTPRERLHQLAERANITSAASCLLARIEYQEQSLENALEYVDLAIYASQISYKVRQAEAFLMKGQILEAQNNRSSTNVYDPAIEEIYRQGLDALQNTKRFGIMAQLHFQLSRYLFSTGKAVEGHQELEIAQKLVGIPSW